MNIESSITAITNCHNDKKDFVRAIQQLRKSKDSLIEECLAPLDKEQIHIICQSILTLLKESICDINVEAEYIFAAAIIVQELIKKFPCNSDVEEFITLLGDNLLKFNDKNLYVQNFCCTVLEKYWLLDVKKKEHLASYVPAFLIAKIISSVGKVHDIERLYNVREMFQVIDFDVPSADGLLDLLQHLPSNPLIYKTHFGIELVQFLMTLNESLMLHIDNAIKSHIPSLQTSALNYIGKMYAKTLQDIRSSPLEKQFHVQCIRDLIDCAIHCHRQGPYKSSPQLHKVLVMLHRHTKSVELRDVLHDLYKPLLWKALKSSNGGVRANATNIFLNAFPLILSSASKVEHQDRLEEQCNTIRELLMDEDEDTRVTAVKGTAIVLEKMWNALPSYHVTEIVKLLCLELPFDKSSSKVVIASLQSIKALLSNPASHVCLKKHVHELASNIHHPSPAVRAALLSLLKSVHHTKLIKFWDIISPDELLKVLGVSSARPTQRMIVGLLGPVFLPRDAALAQQIRSIITEICTEDVPFAYRNFFLHIYPHLGVMSSVILVRALLSIMKELGSEGSVEITNDDSKPIEIHLKDADICRKLFEISAILLTLAYADVCKCEEAKSVVCNKIVPLLPKLLLHFSHKDPSYVEPLFIIISKLPKAGLVGIKKACYRIFNDQHSSLQIAVPAAKSLLRIGEVDTLLSTILQHITRKLKSINDGSSLCTPADTTVLMDFKARDMVGVMEELLSDEEREILLSSEGELDGVYCTLLATADIIPTISQKKTFRSDNFAFLSQCLAVAGRLSIHLVGIDDMIQISRCVEEVVSNADTKKSFKTMLLKYTLPVLVEGYLLLQYNKEFVQQLNIIFASMAETAVVGCHRLSYLKYLYKTGVFATQYGVVEGVVLKDHIKRVLDLVSNSQDTSRDLNDVQSLLLEVVTSSQKHAIVNAKIQPWLGVSDIIVKVFKTRLAEAFADYKDEETTPMRYEGLSGFLQMVTSCSKVSEAFTSSFLQSFTASELTNIETLFLQKFYHVLS